MSASHKLPPLDPECHRQLTTFAGTAPKAIDYEPLANTPAETYQCHEIVMGHVKIYGGEQVFGWMQEATTAGFHEFVFHSVWRSPAGKLIDISPNKGGARRTVFARDTKRRANIEQRDGYNNLLFVSTKAALSEFQRAEWRATVELKKLCWASVFNIRPLSASGKCKQPSLCIDELHKRFGLRVEVAETRQHTIQNLFDLSFNQLVEFEFDYVIYVPGLERAVMAAWPKVRNSPDAPLITFK